MVETITDFLALTNDVIQAIIVIFGSSVVLYNVGRGGYRNRVLRSFSALISFVVLVYLTEVLVIRILPADDTPFSTTEAIRAWLKIQWLGIMFVPAAQYHLSDALFVVMGNAPRWRRLSVRVGYLISGLFVLTVVFDTNWITDATIPINQAVPHLEPARFFALFLIYYVGATAVSVYNVYQARRQSLTSTIRRRLTSTLIAFLAAPIAVFPYLTLSPDINPDISIVLWSFLVVGNIGVGFMFSILTFELAYFGATSPDRVIRVKLYKFLARVPLAGSILLLVYVLVGQSSRLLGLPIDTALGFSLVVTVMLVEWAIHAYKRPFERLFNLNDDPDLRLIQELSERLITTSDLRQFLESVLAATCEALRTPTAFVATITEDGAQLESIVGYLTDSEGVLQGKDWRVLARPNFDETDDELNTADGFILWQGYWLQPLYSEYETVMLGIFGIRGRAEAPNFSEHEKKLLAQLMGQARIALEDRVLQQEVFAAIQKLLPEVTALQKQRSQAELGGLPILTTPTNEPSDLEETLIADPDFNSMVKDALSHYWGGPKLTDSPLLSLKVVQQALEEHENNPVATLRTILGKAIESQRPEGQRSMTTAEWILYNILELKFVQGRKVRDVAMRLAMSESDLYRKQRIAIENVARAIASMEEVAQKEGDDETAVNDT